MTAIRRAIVLLCKAQIGIAAIAIATVTPTVATAAFLAPPIATVTVLVVATAATRRRHDARLVAQAAAGVPQRLSVAPHREEHQRQVVPEGLGGVGDGQGVRCHSRRYYVAPPLEARVRERERRAAGRPEQQIIIDDNNNNKKNKKKEWTCHRKLSQK